MSDSQIAVGDLVVVVRGHCFASDVESTGDIFIVDYLKMSAPGRVCCFCDGDITAQIIAVPVGRNYGYPIAWLKRIPLPAVTVEREMVEVVR